MRKKTIQIQNNSISIKIILVLAAVLLIAPSVNSATVSHKASDIIAGTYQTGGYTYQDNLVVQENFTVDTDTLHIDSGNNRVGIGTASPSNTLDVGGGDFIVNATSGKVGIGTTSPVALLDIKNTTDSVNLYRATDKNGVPRWRIDENFIHNIRTSAGVDTIRFRDSGDCYFNTGSYFGIGTASPSNTLDVGGGDFIVNATSGNVGIGTSSPSTRLHVIDATTTNTNSVILANATGGSGNVYSLRAIKTSGYTGAYAILAESTKTGTTDYQDVMQLTGYGGRGVVLGITSGSTSTTTQKYGIYVNMNSANGIGGYFVGGYGLRIHPNNFERSSVGNMFGCTSTAGTGIGNDCTEICSYHGLSCVNTADVAGSGDRSQWVGAGSCTNVCQNGGASGGILFCICG